jgi:hypothetical protein
MAFKRILVLSAVSLFTLSACDGYEAIKTNTMFPYGNQRTAGSGVAYVLAKMMPKKELKLEAAEPVAKAVERDWKPEVIEMLPEEDKKADKIFHDHGKK